MIDKDSYPSKLCEYCVWTDFGMEPYSDGLPAGPCEGALCKEAKEQYEEDTGKEWEDE